MKHKSKSAQNALACLFFLPLCLLAACADVPVPSWITGEAPREVLQAPRVVSVPTDAMRKDWPNLADVPDEKPVFTSEAIRLRQSEAMNSDRLKGQAEWERLRNVDLYGKQAPSPEAPTAFTSLKADEIPE